MLVHVPLLQHVVLQVHSEVEGFAVCRFWRLPDFEVILDETAKESTNKREQDDYHKKSKPQRILEEVVRVDRHDLDSCHTNDASPNSHPDHEIVLVREVEIIKASEFLLNTNIEDHANPEHPVFFAVAMSVLTEPHEVEHAVGVDGVDQVQSDRIQGNLYGNSGQHDAQIHPEVLSISLVDVDIDGSRNARLHDVAHNLVSRITYHQQNRFYQVQLDPDGEVHHDKTHRLDGNFVGDVEFFIHVEEVENIAVSIALLPFLHREQFKEFLIEVVVFGPLQNPVVADKFESLKIKHNWVDEHSADEVPPDPVCPHLDESIEILTSKVIHSNTILENKKHRHS